jgi:glutathione S-transferase
MRIIWVLEEVGAPYELTVMTQEEGRSDEHLARHPLGRVPVLEDDEGFLFESAAMCLHVGDLYPDSGLIPSLGTHDRALVYQWSCFAPAELEPPLFQAWTQAKQDPDGAEKSRKRFLTAADAVANALDGAEFLVADKFTVADVMVGSALLFTTRVGIADQLPTSLTEYITRLGERPAFQRTLKQTFG